ncbi:inorganic pyrophosphatase [Anaerolineae bacterium]|nr:inorganic pyrophosphatase [Anaerolineae bacterium]
MNLWKELPTGSDAPNVVNVVVEIPKGSRNKLKYDLATGVIQLDRVLPSPLRYPGDYGLIPQTLFDDGGPLDILVMVTEPTFSGCVIQAQPIGVFQMTDQDKADDKILAVPVSDPAFNECRDIADIPAHLLKEIAHFFEVYKDMEGGRVKTAGWDNSARAKARIAKAVARFHAQEG